MFITPPGAKRQVECAPVRADGQATVLSCKNTGNAYAQLREAVLTRDDRQVARFEGGTYILPGATKAIPLRSEGAVLPGPASLSLMFDDGQRTTSSIALP